VSVGQEAPLHSTALGKATLAALPPERAKALLNAEPFPRYTEQTMTTWQELSADIEATQARGYAVDQEEMILSAACVGAPIMGKANYPVGPLSVSGLATRVDGDRRAEVGDRVVEWCRRISAEFGHLGPLFPETAG